MIPSLFSHHFSPSVHVCGSLVPLELVVKYLVKSSAEMLANCTEVDTSPIQFMFKVRLEKKNAIDFFRFREQEKNI